MDNVNTILQRKQDYLIPCVYHFYQRPPVLVCGEGAHLFDTDGRKYLDCYSGVSVMNAGHCNQDILDAAIDQMRRLQHTTTIYLTEPMLELAAKIAKLAPAGLRRSFFCSSGSEANEGAVLLATLATKKKECVFLRGGLHGRTKWAMNLNGLDMWRTDPDPLITALAAPGPCEPQCLFTVEKLLRRDTVAAVIAEPIQGNGGIIVPPDHFWPELRRLCIKYGTLLIADEIQTAWNRTGKWFATEHMNVVPDIVTVAKALGNGFPIAAFLTTDAIASHYTKPGASTFGGNLVSCRAALATLAFHKRYGLAERSSDLGTRLIHRLRDLQQHHAVINEVRGRGLMIGVEIRTPDKLSGALTDKVLETLKDMGFLLGKTGPERNVLTIMPPLIVEEEAILSLANAIDQALHENTN